MRLYNTLALAIVVGTTSTQAEECGPSGSVTMAGSSTVYPLAMAWYEAFNSKCPSTSMIIESGGSSAGAGRVCGNLSKGQPVDIGNMSREWKSSEATVASNGWQYDCTNGSRSAAQIPVAGDGISVVVKAGGVGAECIASLGGLTHNQLRWIFSSFTQSQLVSDGWDASSITKTNRNDNTRLWSDLSSACTDDAIEIAGPDDKSGTYEFFKEVILTGSGETFRSSYFNSADDEDIVDHIVGDGSVVGYFGYAFYSEHKDDLYAAALENADGNFVAPSPETVLDGSYNPLSRNIYMNFLIDSILENTLPYLEFGFSSDGDTLTNSVGYVPLSDASKTEMEMQRISTLYHNNVWTDAQKDDYWCEISAQISSAGSSTVAPVMMKWAEAYGGTQGLCSKSSVSVEGGGSSTGAKRVCGVTSAGSPVMIGNMSRDWKSSEASKEGSMLSCLIGDSSISVTQLPVALDGITIATAKGSAAEKCINILGGLEVDILNVIFSDSLGGLEIRWSDLNADCDDVPIQMTGPDSSHGTYEFFAEVVLKENESFSPLYVEAEDAERVKFLNDNSGGIGYFGYVSYAQNSNVLSAVPIKNSSGKMVVPTTSSIADGSYNPFSRYIYINVNNKFMGKIYSFLKYAFSGIGSQIVEEVGYVPIAKSSTLWQKTWADIVKEAENNFPRKKLLRK